MSAQGVAQRLRRFALPLGYLVAAPAGRWARHFRVVRSPSASFLFAPKEPQHVSPGQSEAAQPRSAALGIRA
jgi:hypothetical protein